MEQTKQPGRFGTFTGVFTPTLLTILGVIMYVRIGWVVGNAGLAGAFAIMTFGLVITTCTGLSLSSIATNTRLGAGGPYAIVRRSLGLEVAGSVGIPLYLTRPLGVAMYIFGFREGVEWLATSFGLGAPSALVVDLGAFGLLFAVAYASADLAFKVQFGILAIVGLSLLSVLLGAPTFHPVVEPTMFGDYPGFPESDFGGTDFWGVFAVFFPATTGILAGANMSGDLKDPRTAIPKGTLAAIGLSSLIYFLLALWASRAGTPEELVSDYMLLVDRAWAPGLVLLGLLGATASSALAGLVGGPRILMAMGENRLLPGSEWLAQTTPTGEPRNAAIVTGVLTFACLMVRDLNAIAPLVTMFFLITYCFINVVVLFEQALGLVSFRPTLSVPIYVPLVGSIGSLFAMFIVNPTFGLLAVGLVIGVYLSIERFVEIDENSSGEARSSVFVALAEYAAHRAAGSPLSVRAWKPSMLVPFEHPEDVRGAFDLICDAALPEGSVKLLGLATTTTPEDLRQRMEGIERAFGDRRLPVSSTVIDTADYRTGVSAGLQALQSAFFRPNLLFLPAPEDPSRYDESAELVKLARRTGVGTFLVARHPVVGLGQRRLVTIWIRGGDWSFDGDVHGRNLNLAVLMGYRIAKRWSARLRLVCIVGSVEEVAPAEAFLAELVDVARLKQSSTERRVEVGSFEDALRALTSADLNILGLQAEPDFEFVARIVGEARSTCLFVVDSGRESALA